MSCNLLGKKEGVCGGKDEVESWRDIGGVFYSRYLKIAICLVEINGDAVRDEASERSTVAEEGREENM